MSATVVDRHGMVCVNNDKVWYPWNVEQECIICNAYLYCKFAMLYGSKHSLYWMFSQYVHDFWKLILSILKTKQKSNFRPPDHHLLKTLSSFVTKEPIENRDSVSQFISPNHKISPILPCHQCNVLSLVHYNHVHSASTYLLKRRWSLYSFPPFIQLHLPYFYISFIKIPLWTRVFALHR